METPMMAISTMQPWTELLAAGIKDVENRTMKTSYRGPILLHASKRFDDGWIDKLRAEARTIAQRHVTNALVGRMGAKFLHGHIVAIGILTTCTLDNNSIWATPGFAHLQIKHVMRIQPYPAKGQLGLFDVSVQQFNKQQKAAHDHTEYLWKKLYDVETIQ